MAVILGRALGARVIAVAAGKEKLDFCTRLGADEVIDRTAGSVRHAIKEATDGRGADVVYDLVGGPVATDALRATASFGRFLVVGNASGEWIQVDGADLTMSNRSVVGVIANSGTPEENLAAHESLIGLFAEGRLDPAVTTVSFDDLADAVQSVEDGTVMGKLVVRVAAP